MEYIGTNLAAPLDLLLITLKSSDFLFLLFLLQLKELGPKHLQTLLAVLELGALILTLNHNSCRLMGHTNSGGSLIDVLTTGTRGAVGINTNLIHINLNLFSVIQLRHNITSTEGGMTTGCGIEWRNTYQTMYALFGLQKAISVVSLDKESNRLNAGLITWEEVGSFHSKAMTLSITAIHSKEHAGPVLSLSAAGTCMKGQNCIVGIILAGKHNLQLKLLQRLVNLSHIDLDILLHAFILVIHADFPHYLHIIVLGYKGLVFINTDLNIVKLLVDFLGTFRIIPKSRLTHFIFQFCNFFFFMSHIQSLFHLVQSLLECRNTWLQILQHVLTSYLNSY